MTMRSCKLCPTDGVADVRLGARRELTCTVHTSYARPPDAGRTTGANAQVDVVPRRPHARPVPCGRAGVRAVPAAAAAIDAGADVHSSLAIKKMRRRLHSIACVLINPGKCNGYYIHGQHGGSLVSNRNHHIRLFEINVNM